MIETLKTLNTICDLFNNKQFTELRQLDKNLVDYILNLKYPHIKDEYLGIETDIDSNDSTTSTKSRDYAHVFRDNIIKKFNKRCPLSDFPAEYCQACHIYEYKDCKTPEDRYSRDNGILLSPDYHFFYDNNNFIINSNTCCIEVLKPFPKSENIQGKYIKELDNYISKNYLNLRNQKK